MCLCVLICLCVFYLGLVDFWPRRVFQSFFTKGYFVHLASKGKLVILFKKVIIDVLVRMVIFTKLLVSWG